MKDIGLSVLYGIRTAIILTLVLAGLVAIVIALVFSGPTSTAITAFALVAAAGAASHYDERKKNK